MSQYVTNTSDKKKAKALRWWMIGCFGAFGFENFYVGKIKNGLIHLFFGLVFIEFIVASIAENTPYLPILFWPILALPNLYKIKMGTFRDNVGAVLRE